MLKLLKEATKKLKGRGLGCNSAIQEVLPTYNQLLLQLKNIKDCYTDATREDFLLAKLIKDYIKQNVTRSYIKLSKYYKLTGKTLIYYAAVVLHLGNKVYC